MTMARQAQHDERLVASHILACAGHHGTDWTGVARQLAITLEQLSRLALCRVPRQDRYADDVDRIAEYVGMEPATLAWFLEDAVSPSRQRVRTVPNNGGSTGQRARIQRSPFNLRRLGLAVASLALAAFLGAFVLSGTRKASAATLVVSEGEATLVSESRTLLVFTHQNETQVAQGGTLAVSTGDAIGVPQGGSAYLRLSDGSTVDLDGGTVIKVAELVTTHEAYRVRLDMLAGRTVNRVQRVLGAGDAFEVNTPSSSASVRGTVFTVEVIDDETTYVAVSEGTVWFEIDGQTIELHEGDEITGRRGQPLSTETPTEEPTLATADPATVAPADDSDQPRTPTSVPTETPTAEPELAAPATTQPPTVQPVATTQPARMPTDPPVPTEEILGDEGDTGDDTLGDVDNTDDTVDDGVNPNDDKDDIIDGDAGIGNNEDKDENPDNGNNGIGNNSGGNNNNK